jgi:queuine tRNA-ribosyltransferase
MSRLNFTIEAKASGSRARAASFITAHGQVSTPIFMPVGTQATVKTQSIKSLKTTGSRVLLANTYHLLLRPGPEVFKKLGGIHRFMGWDGPILTDSGGFQIFSLPNAREMNEAGASFQSYTDGKTHILSPELSIEMQKAIGSDIMMVLDQCISSVAEYPEALAAMELTHRWAKRSFYARGESGQALFAIVQGACFGDLRQRSAEYLSGMPFDGFAIGGLAVGETKAQREDFTELTVAHLPENRPRYLMGVGTPIDLLEAVYRGVDMFDCILPSQLAQRGTAFTSTGRLQLRRVHHKFSDEALDSKCPCETCTHHSRAYLHHLYKTGETLGWKLLTTHNLTFYHRMMADIRNTILEDTFEAYYHDQRKQLSKTDNSHPTGPPPPNKRSKKKLQLGDYQLFSGTEGVFSLRQLSSGEVMHPGATPSHEANRLYVEQPELANRILENNEEPLIIWDVGLGAATNAMAALRLFEVTTAQSGNELRNVQLFSFENDLDPLRLALNNHEKFPHLHHAAPHALLQKHYWIKNNFEWRLITGNFLDKFDSCPIPDVVFYDPFSTKTDFSLWHAETFSRLFKHCASKDSSLYTYSCSTAVRCNLLRAGYFVARGFSSGRQNETTVAYTPLAAKTRSRNLLSSSWIERWERSQVKFPPGTGLSEQEQFENLIINHPQFKYTHTNDHSD